MQGTGWEHFSAFGLNGVVSLTHGQNPVLPTFRNVSTGVAMTTDFNGTRPYLRSQLERTLNRYWRLTDTWLGAVVGGIPEVQFMLQRLPEHVVQLLKRSHDQGHTHISGWAHDQTH
jgi:hypothetical protein